jgi:hypothetical protein
LAAATPQHALPNQATNHVYGGRPVNAGALANINLASPSFSATATSTASCRGVMDLGASARKSRSAICSARCSRCKADGGIPQHRQHAERL